MVKRPTVTTISTGYYSTTALNENFENIRDQFDNTLSLDGSTPNAMQADLDLNNFNLLNANVYSKNLYIRGQLVGSLSTAFNWKGLWASSTSYSLYDVVSNEGNSYISLEAHTSGSTFSVDLAVGKWELLAAKGASGAGTGDLLSTNNLSELTDPASALGNLGLTATATELNFVDGVTSNIQTQLDAKIESSLASTLGGGLFKGENGEVGSSAGDIFRVNEQTLNTNVTIDADENASATGPLTVASGVTLTVTSGGTLSIV